MGSISETTNICNLYNQHELYSGLWQYKRGTRLDFESADDCMPYMGNQTCTWRLRWSSNSWKYIDVVQLWTWDIRFLLVLKISFAWRFLNFGCKLQVPKHILNWWSIRWFTGKTSNTYLHHHLQRFIWTLLVNCWINNIPSSYIVNRHVCL